MSRSLRALFVSLPLALPLLATGGLAHAQQAFGYDEAERQQELLEVWYEIRESNAQKGNTAAMFDVGMANYAGRGTAVDYDQALRWFARAADADHASAHYYLGYLFATGKGTSADAERSHEHYSRAAELGHADAQYWLGSHLANGEQDPTAALEWLGKAADQGLPAAQYYVGLMHENGQGTSRDPAAAARWYTAAAEQGYRHAQIGLGRLHQNGRGVERDLVQAHVWYSMADDRERLASLETRMNNRDLVTAQGRLKEQNAALQAASAR
ncbi:MULTISPECIES: tetratricopeptide repeat protein [unclassified Thioalkalivibrio]|uniref:tetratricopeptide repeat protein n=1 Tax=unclassified Thioalkalivibrio TaxID=2621013 RepID=UPI00056E3617|nr:MULTISPECIES: tetratricopeptide repeat protein [unclassified Thioalkalivibrio]